MVRGRPKLYMTPCAQPLTPCRRPRRPRRHHVIQSTVRSHDAGFATTITHKPHSKQPHTATKAQAVMPPSHTTTCAREPQTVHHTALHSHLPPVVVHAGHVDAATPSTDCSRFRHDIHTTHIAHNRTRALTRVALPNTHISTCARAPHAVNAQHAQPLTACRRPHRPRQHHVTPSNVCSHVTRFATTITHSQNSIQPRTYCLPHMRQLRNIPHDAPQHPLCTPPHMSPLT